MKKKLNKLIEKYEIELAQVKEQIKDCILQYDEKVSKEIKLCAQAKCLEGVIKDLKVMKGENRFILLLIGLAILTSVFYYIEKGYLFIKKLFTKKSK
tara:strand:- start:1792 stop:2082 length:291 start_codon:yes stop_codon:yes gene_type:complete